MDTYEARPRLNDRRPGGVILRPPIKPLSDDEDADSILLVPEEVFGGRDIFVLITPDGSILTLPAEAN